MNEFVAWGDSLTYGAGGGGVSWRSVFTALSGVPVVSRAVGGETSTQIASRANGTPLTFSVTADSIPASSTTTTTCTTSSGIPTSQSGSVVCYYDGIRLTLSYLSGSTSNVFRSESVASDTPVPGNSLLVCEQGIADRYRKQVIWVGRNDSPPRASVESNITGIINYGRTGKYLIVGVTNNSAEPAGSSGYTDIVNLNARLAVAYGERFLDIRTILVNDGMARAGLAPTGSDLAEIATDRIPGSLRSDSTHLNAAGYTVVGTVIYERLMSLGWV